MAMESVSLSQVIFATNKNSFQRRKKQPLVSSYIRKRFEAQYGHRFPFGIIKSYKQSDYQDFQGYAKPSRLLPVKELEILTETSEGTAFPFLNDGISRSLFKIKLRTSNAYGSSLSDRNAGILLSLIDTNGDSILQRIPALLKSDSAGPEDAVEFDTLHFQRGSIDEFTFEGPQLGNIEALWISVESGQWRLGGVSLSVINADQPKGNREQEIQYTGFQYEFEVDDVLLGEGSDISMVELRPCDVSELSGVDLFAMLSKSPSQSTSLHEGSISNEESMKEYADLKASLLSYDATLILVGTAIANFSAGESAAFAFFIGGVGGFLYLLLLQRSVDELPASPSTSRSAGKTGIDRLFGGLRGPISNLVLAIGLTSLAVKNSFGEVPLMLTAKELVVGMMGFLVCKVAVVLAAVKPSTQSLKDE